MAEVGKFYNAANNASTKLTVAMSPADTDCTVVSTLKFPEVPFLISIDDEIIEVGGVDGNKFTGLVRGMEGTTPSSHDIGTLVENRMTAGMYANLLGKGEKAADSALLDGLTVDEVRAGTTKKDVGLENVENKSAETIRTEYTSPIRVEVVSSFPSHADGKIVYHSVDNKFYGSANGEWV